MTLVEPEELIDLDAEILCEHLPPCGRAAELMIILVCRCDRFACLPCRNINAAEGFINRVCRTCGAPLDGPWKKIVIREVTL